MSLVSIAIASYNNAPYIDRCMESVINQTYSNLEILFVDDGSKDNTLELISKYQKDNRVVIIEKENGGLSSVRQRALDEATGDYICFIDADDYLTPHYVECMLNKLFEDKSDICVCGTKFIDSYGNDLTRLTQSFKSNNSKEPFRTTATEFALVNNVRIKQLYLSDSWNKLYLVSFLRETGVRFNMPKGLNGTDTLFNRTVALHAPLYSTVADELYVHVIYSSSAVHRKHKNLLKTYQIVTETSIRESQSLGIYEKTYKYIIYKYQTNLCEVLIDESKETKGFKSFVQRLKEIRNTNKTFALENDRRILIYKNNTIINTIIMILFQNCVFVLPLYIELGKKMNQIIKFLKKRVNF